MRLVIEDAAGTRSVVPFATDEITLGRAREGNTFRLEERTVSRLHARLVRASGAVFIEDLGSLTGTRVNGERISGRRRLREGDLIEIGGYDLALLPEEDRPGAPPALRPTPAPGVAGPAATAPGTSAAAPSTAAVAPPAPVPADAAGASVREPVVAPLPAAPSRPGAPGPAKTPAPAATAPPHVAAPPVAAPAAVAPAAAAAPVAPAAAALPGSGPAAAPTSPAASPASPAPGPADRPAPLPSAPAASPLTSQGALGRALLAGGVALVLGFGAGWAVGVLTAREPPPAADASAAR